MRMSKEFEDIAARYQRLKSLHVGILVFPGVEVLDFAGPFEVFSVASRVSLRDLGIESPFRVSLIGIRQERIEARHGMGILPHFSMRDAPEPDLLIVPGGVMDYPLQCETTQEWVKRASGTAALTASVCTGAFLLARLGILDGHPVTTHWEDIPGLRAQFPRLEVKEQVPFIDNGRVLTSAGISAGIGMSLHLVQRVLGAGMAAATARQMEYDWMPSRQVPTRRLDAAASILEN